MGRVVIAVAVSATVGAGVKRMRQVVGVAQPSRQAAVQRLSLVAPRVPGELSGLRPRATRARGDGLPGQHRRAVGQDGCAAVASSAARERSSSTG